MIFNGPYLIEIKDPVEIPPKEKWEIVFNLYGGDADIYLERSFLLPSDQADDLKIILDFREELLGQSYSFRREWMYESKVLRPYIDEGYSFIELQLPSSGVMPFGDYPSDPTTLGERYCALESIDLFFWDSSGTKLETEVKVVKNSI